MITQSQFLSSEEQQIIHADSLKILREVGALYHSDRALDIPAKNGADVDKDSKIARIPEEMVDQALKTAPKSFVLGARVPEKILPYPRPTVVMCWTTAASLPAISRPVNGATPTFRIT
ncbi:MAG: trimethylamine methyltransferase family protein, partial [Deltaproteobacteria bacterium]|nr:trimethylamine methyltransferase family protein [Deltaproteobacteria bacterium]